MKIVPLVLLSLCAVSPSLLRAEEVGSAPVESAARPVSPRDCDRAAAECRRESRRLRNLRLRAAMQNGDLAPGQVHAHPQAAEAQHDVARPDGVSFSDSADERPGSWRNRRQKMQDQDQ
ncbi:hypothetical protein HZU77_002325 [Neisseriaceae bacterium TC5R-5]|nr:hypothetical protein [Neisseriaceae bacterium TC5R-5]